MALSYQQSSDLMSDGVFIGRVKVGCLKYADYITGESPGVPAHPTRVRWAQNVFQNPDNVAQTITPTVVMDAAVQQDGAGITDAALQSAVENAVNKVL
jgi:hypothetical protein